MTAANQVKQWSDQGKRKISNSVHYFEVEFYQKRQDPMDFLRWHYRDQQGYLLKFDRTSAPLKAVSRCTGEWRRDFDGRAAFIAFDSFKMKKPYGRRATDNFTDMYRYANDHTHMTPMAGFYSAHLSRTQHLRWCFGVCLDFDKVEYDENERKLIPVEALIERAEMMGYTINLINETPRGYQVWFSCHPIRIKEPFRFSRRYNELNNLFIQAFADLGADPNCVGLAHMYRVPTHPVYVNMGEKNDFSEFFKELTVKEQVELSEEDLGPVNQLTRVNFLKGETWLNQPVLKEFLKKPCPVGHRAYATFWLACCLRCLKFKKHEAKAYLHDWAIKSGLTEAEFDRQVECAFNRIYAWRYRTVKTEKLRVIPGLENILPMYVKKYQRKTNYRYAKRGEYEKRLHELSAYLGKYDGQVVTRAELANLLGCSIRSVQKYLTRLSDFEFQRTSRGLLVKRVKDQAVESEQEVTVNAQVKSDHKVRINDKLNPNQGHEVTSKPVKKRIIRYDLTEFWQLFTEVCKLYNKVPKQGTPLRLV